jgi:ribosomal protein S20
MSSNKKNICSLLEKKLSLFQRYLSVTNRIKEAFVEEGKGNPGVFISERQGLIDGIEKIDSAMKRIVEEDGRRFVSERNRDKIETHLQDIRKLMETVESIDEELVTMVGREEEEAKRSLLKMQNARRAVSGYQRTGKSAPRFFDKLR